MNLNDFNVTEKWTLPTCGVDDGASCFFLQRPRLARGLPDWIFFCATTFSSTALSCSGVLWSLADNMAKIRINLHLPNVLWEVYLLGSWTRTYRELNNYRLRELNMSSRSTHSLPLIIIFVSSAEDLFSTSNFNIPCRTLLISGPIGSWINKDSGSDWFNSWKQIESIDQYKILTPTIRVN